MVGIFTGNSRNNGADKHLVKTACRRENHSSYKDSEIGALREEHRADGKEHQTDNAENWRTFDRQRNVEFVREKGEHKVNSELCYKVDKHQRTERGVGYTVHGVEGEKEQGREIAHDRHSDVACVAGKLNALVIFSHNRVLC